MRLIFVASLLVLTACGGSSERSNGSASRGGSSGAPGCEYDGKAYANGATFEASDGCNSCHCEAGAVACTEIGCGPGLTCASASTSYAALMDQAKACDPTQPNPCTKRVSEGLGCVCDTFVNPAGYDEAATRETVARFDAASCNQNANCGPCSPAVTARCSAAGVCVSDSDPTDGTACRVGGLTYQNGSVGVPDPYSCNQCECRDGSLICTEINCATPCPEGTSPGTSCAECGADDDCLVVETGCLPACESDCAAADVCSGGVCKKVCG